MKWHPEQKKIVDCEDATRKRKCCALENRTVKVRFIISPNGAQIYNFSRIVNKKKRHLVDCLPFFPFSIVEYQSTKSRSNVQIIQRVEKLEMLKITRFTTQTIKIIFTEAPFA